MTVFWVDTTWYDGWFRRLAALRQDAVPWERGRCVLPGVSREFLQGFIRPQLREWTGSTTVLTKKNGTQNHSEFVLHFLMRCTKAEFVISVAPISFFLQDSKGSQCASSVEFVVAWPNPRNKLGHIAEPAKIIALWRLVFVLLEF